MRWVTRTYNAVIGNVITQKMSRTGQVIAQNMSRAISESRAILKFSGLSWHKVGEVVEQVADGHDVPAALETTIFT